MTRAMSANRLYAKSVFCCLMSSAVIGLPHSGHCSSFSKISKPQLGHSIGIIFSPIYYFVFNIVFYIACLFFVIIGAIIGGVKKNLEIELLYSLLSGKG